MAVSGCTTVYAFDDGTLQGWTANNVGNAGWRVSSLQSNSGSYSAWFGNPSTSNSLHPNVGAPSFSGGRSRGTLTSPPTTVSSTDLFSFDLRMAIESATQYDTFRLYIVQGGTRRELWNKSQSGFAVTNHPENPGAVWDLLTSNGTWATMTVTVGTPSGINLANPVQFEFDFQTVDGNYNRTEGVFIDNLTMSCAATLGTPSEGGARSASVGRKIPPYLPGYAPPPVATVSEEREPPSASVEELEETDEADEPDETAPEAEAENETETETETDEATPEAEPTPEADSTPEPATEAPPQPEAESPEPPAEPTAEPEAAAEAGSRRGPGG